MAQSTKTLLPLKQKYMITAEFSIYDDVYSIKDVKNFCKMINDIHNPQLVVKVISITDERKK